MAVSFRTYRDAHVALRIPGSHMVGTQGTPRTGVRSLKLTCHEDSRDELLDGGATIMCDHTCACSRRRDVLRRYVGRGVKPSPANPVAHQSSADQDVFRTSINTRTRCRSCVENAVPFSCR
jgi:hypothetical protein